MQTSISHSFTMQLLIALASHVLHMKAAAYSHALCAQSDIMHLYSKLNYLRTQNIGSIQNFGFAVIVVVW